jgi:AbrB family looped-hinge helix DNA binding protein
MQQEAKITSKGQITIPQAIRRALRLREGDIVVVETDEHGVQLYPRRPASVFAEYEGIWRKGEGNRLTRLMLHFANCVGMMNDAGMPKASTALGIPTSHWFNLPMCSGRLRVGRAPVLSAPGA